MGRLKIVRLALTVLVVLGVLAPATSAAALELSVELPLISLDVEVDLGVQSLEQIAWGEEGGPNASLDHIAEAIGADHLHDRGITGAGVGVALIDTGVAAVPGLEDVWIGPDLSLDSPVEEIRGHDLYGHGTHLAGIIASDRPDAPGIAPDADLVSVKVGAANGAVDVSQAIAAIDWVVQHKDEHNIRVLALAYGTDGTQDPRRDPLAHAVQTAWRNGIVVVVAVGNHGDTADAVVNPATDPYVIAVGAADTHGTASTVDDDIPSFSAPGTWARRPDLYAPGVGVLSLRTPDGYLDQTYPQARRDGELFRGNGTSQSAAIVAGAAALLLQDRPNLTPDQVKNVLTRSTIRLDNLLSGRGTIDVARASTTLPLLATQRHPVSRGDGTLEGARGSTHLGEGEDILDGERDIFGQPFDTAAWAAAATARTTWADGWWNGTQWTGTGWDGQAWNGWSWHGWSWHGWSWHGWSWHGWSWHGWSWHGWSWH